MKSLSFNNWQPSPLLLFLAITGIFGGVAPVQASPQIRYHTIEHSGSPQICLRRARLVIVNLGFPYPVITNYRVVGKNKNRDVTVTVSCRRRTPYQFQAIITVAASDTIAPNSVHHTLHVVRKGMSHRIDPIPPTPALGQTAMSHQAFKQFLSALEDSWPHHVAFLRQPTSWSYFTADQIRRIVNLVGPTRELEVAVLLYLRVVDPQNWFIVEQAITFTGDRQELRERLSGN